MSSLGAKSKALNLSRSGLIDIIIITFLNILQVAYVHLDNQVKVQTCPGVPPKDDLGNLML